MWEAVVILLVLAIAWQLYKFGTAYFFPEKGAGLLLRREAQKRGVDVSAIPESALDEIVGRSISIAKAMAQLDRGKSNWRLNLVEYIELDADRLASLLKKVGMELEADTARQT